MKNAFLLVFIALLLALAACGGGSGSSNSNSNSTTTTAQATPGAAQGVYSGTTSANYAFQGIVLPNDRLYAIYGTKSTSGFLVYGLMIGQGTSMSNGKFNGTYTDYYYTGTVYPGTLAATYVAGASLGGSYSENGTTYNINATPMASTDFNYNTPASLSQIAGTWSGTALDATSGTFTVNANGSFSGSVQGCSITGSLTPDTTKNFFNVTMTFGPSPCASASQTATGIAVTYLLSDGVHHQLLVAGSNATMGALFIAEQ